MQPQRVKFKSVQIHMQQVSYYIKNIQHDKGKVLLHSTIRKLAMCRRLDIIHHLFLLLVPAHRQSLICPPGSISQAL